MSKPHIVSSPYGGYAEVTGPGAAVALSAAELVAVGGTVTVCTLAYGVWGFVGSSIAAAIALHYYGRAITVIGDDYLVGGESSPEVASLNEVALLDDEPEPNILASADYAY